jgi:NAD(P)H dehydrogenase (quinone)
MLKSSRTNDSRPRIAIAGATGRVGSALIASLVSEPLDLVALTRNPDAQRVPSDVSLAVVDFDVPSSLEDALRSADRLFLAHGTSPRQVDNEIALIDAAVGAGVGHIVKLSAMGVRRAKAALSSGCKSHPANAPAGSNRSSHGGNEVAEAFD